MSKADKSSGKWKNLLASYPLFVKKYYLQTNNLLSSPMTCVTLYGMYFLWFLELQVHKNSLYSFLEKEQGEGDIKELLIYNTEGTCCIFKEIITLKGKCSNLLSNTEFNKSLVYLIESYRIIPVNSTDGVVWTVNKEKGDLCHLETILKKYSGFMG